MTTALSTGIRRAAARIAPDPAPDGELLSRFLAARDEAAFAVLVRRHAAMVFGTCRRVLGNAPDADDAFQAAFVVLVRKAHSLTDRACVGNFLYGVAFHTALKARAMATKRKAKEAQVANATRPESADRGELSRALDEELAHLPEKYREPVVLCELEGVSRRDAAGRLGVPEGTISSRLATAHRMLEKRLKARGFAAVAIAAVFGSQAFAVSDSLADAAVRAAVNGPPAGVTHLAAEVTKMFLLTKLKVGTAVLASVVLLLGTGVGLIERGTAADARRAMRAPVPKKDEPKTDRERILGTWVMSEIKQVGVTPTDEQKKRWAAGGFNITFTADEMICDVDQSRVKYRLDPAKDPKVIEILEGDTVVALGLYEFTGDELKVCLGRRAEKGMPPVAPTGFDPATQPNTFPTLFVMKRDQPKAKPAAKKPDDAKAILGQWAESSSAEFPPRVFAPTDKVFKAKNYWTFGTDGKLTNVSTVAGETHTGERQFQLNPDASPKELLLTTGGLKMTWSYELNGDTLKVALCGDGKVRPPSIDPKDIPQGVSVSIVEFTRVKDDQPAADKEYSLKDGEVLKLIPAPFPDARNEVVRLHKDHERLGRNYGWDQFLVPVTVENGQPVAVGVAIGRRNIRPNENGTPLSLLLTSLLRLDLTSLSDPDWLLQSAVVDCDVLLKKGATPAEWVPALRGELKAKCGVDLVLEFREVETEVIVVRGKHTLNPERGVYDSTRPSNASLVELFTSEKRQFVSGKDGTSRDLVGVVAQFLGRPVVDESDLATNEVAMGVRCRVIQPSVRKDAPVFGSPEAVFADLTKQTGLTFKLEKRKVRALVVEQPQKDDKPATDKEYSLAPGEVLKLLPSPFPAGRDKVFDRIPAGKRTGSPVDTNLLAVSVGGGSDEVSEFAARRWKDGEPVKPPQLLQYVKHLLKIDTATVSDPNWLLESTVLDADVVFRKSAKPDELLAALSRELKAKCGADVTFTFREVETEVVVLSGKHTLKRNHAFAGRPYNDAARVRLVETGTAARSGGTAHLPAELATFAGRPVVDESDLTTNDVAVWITSPSYDTRPQAADRDPAAALKRFAEQTGLSAKLEKRKVRALVVGQANPDRKGGGDKKPDDAKQLLGRWALNSMTCNPPRVVSIADKGLASVNVWTFGENGKLHVESFVGNDRAEDTKLYELNTEVSPKELRVTSRGTSLTYIYELRGDSLKLAMLSDGMTRPTSFDPKDKPEKIDEFVLMEFGREVEEPKKDEVKKPAEPAWKAEFRKAYGLSDGQLVRRVAPPYPDCRTEYFRDLIQAVYQRQKLVPDEAAVNKDYGDHFTKFGWKDGWMADGLTAQRVPTKPDEGVPLDYLLDVTLGFARTRIESDATTLERKVTGDFVVRAGADPEKVAVQLEAILRKELELPVKFSFKDAEEEVFVLSGKYAAKPVDDRKANEIEVYANHLTERKTGGGGTGTLKEMLAAVERHVSKPVVLGKVDGGPAKVSWHYNVRSPMLRDPARGIDTHRDDTNPAQVLGRLADQTGLSVTTEKRKVRLLVVQYDEVKK